MVDDLDIYLHHANFLVEESQLSCEGTVVAVVDKIETVHFCYLNKSIRYVLLAPLFTDPARVSLIEIFGHQPLALDNHQSDDLRSC